MNLPQNYGGGERPFVVFPLGLGYIAAVLKKYGFDVHVLDCLGEGIHTKTHFHNRRYLLGLTFKQIKHRIKQIYPDIVLLSCPFSLQNSLVIETAWIIKSLKKNVRIIVGGNHASAMAEEILQDQNIDFVIVGEGELPLIKLMDSLKKGSVSHDIKGVGYKKCGKICINRNKEFVIDLDTLPFPAWSLFPIENYLRSQYKHTLLPNKYKTGEVITSRGCPVGCGYCASHVVNGKVWRIRSIKNVMGEIRYLHDVYGVGEIHFEDDNLLLNRKRFEQLCRGLSKLHIRWTVPNGVNIEKLDNALLCLMKKSGCYALYLPVESNNPQMFIKHIKKGINLPHLRYIIKHAKKMSYYLTGFFLIGFYDETKEDIKSNVEFAISLGLDEAHFSILTPFPGTEYYNTYSPNLNKYEFLSPKNANVNTKFFRKKELEKMRDWAYFHFETHKLLKKPWSYLNPVQIRKLIRYIRYFTINFRLID